MVLDASLSPCAVPLVLLSLPAQHDLHLRHGEVLQFMIFPAARTNHRTCRYLLGPTIDSVLNTTFQQERTRLVIARNGGGDLIYETCNRSQLG